MRDYMFQVDEDNRLIIKNAQQEIPVPGSFTVDKSNRLTYRPLRPAVWKRKYALAPAQAFEGKWELDEKHNLIFVLRKG